MKINYIRKQSGKRTTIILPNSICELWFTTRPHIGERWSKEAHCELLEQLDDPHAGIVSTPVLVPRTF